MASSCVRVCACVCACARTRLHVCACLRAMILAKGMQDYAHRGMASPGRVNGRWTVGLLLPTTNL